jgi:hypothetical protein
MTQTQASDELTAALDEIRASHRQHVSINFPEPGICVSRDGSWPCNAGRLLVALDEVLKLADKGGTGVPPVRIREAISRALLGGAA